MKKRKILNIEDYVGKHCDIDRALSRYNYPKSEWATKGEDGVKEIEVAIANGEPYDLLILDMHFPFNGIDDFDGGFHVIEELKKKNISIPIIVFSTRKYNIPGTIGAVCYNKNKDWESSLKEILDSYFQ